MSGFERARGPWQRRSMVVLLPSLPLLLAAAGGAAVHVPAPALPTPLPDDVSSYPLCLAAPPPDGVYTLSADAPAGPGPICPAMVSPKLSAWMGLACMAREERVAVLGGCVGFAPETRAFVGPGRRGARLAGANAVVRSYGDGKACASGWSESWRAGGEGAFEVTREAHSTCGGGGPITGPALRFVRSSAIAGDGAAALAAHARGATPEVAAAALERLLGDQTLPEACAALGALLRERAAEGADATRAAHGVRILEAARAPCLAGAVEEALGSAALGWWAPTALTRVVPDEKARARVLVRAVDGGASGVVHAASSVVTSLRDPAVRAPLAGELEARLVSRVEGVRGAAARALGALVAPGDFARRVLRSAARKRDCAVRAWLMKTHFVPNFLEPAEVARLFRPLLRDAKCADAAVGAALQLAIVLEHAAPVADAVWAELLALLRGPHAAAAKAALAPRVAGPLACYRDGPRKAAAPARDAALAALAVPLCKGD